MSAFKHQRDLLGIDDEDDEDDDDDEQPDESDDEDQSDDDETEPPTGSAAAGNGNNSTTKSVSLAPVASAYIYQSPSCADDGPVFDVGVGPCWRVHAVEDGANRVRRAVTCDAATSFRAIRWRCTARSGKLSVDWPSISDLELCPYPFPGIRFRLPVCPFSFFRAICPFSRGKTLFPIIFRKMLHFGKIPKTFG